VTTAKEKSDMHEEQACQEAMASSTPLKAAKKELRSLMKIKLLGVSKESIDTQSS
jgi:hypothetical protein